MTVFLKRNPREKNFYIEFRNPSGPIYKHQIGAPMEKVRFVIVAKYQDGWHPYFGASEFADRREAERVWQQRRASQFKLRLLATLEGAEPFVMAKNY